MRVILLVFAWISLVAVPVLAQVVERKPDPVHGKKLAERLCVNCHLVDSTQKEVNVDIPSFREIAKKQGQTEGAIIAHIFLPKHPMPQISLTASELADIAAYIVQLRDRRPSH
jgi:mono/diheme cytochrome c family protein